MLAGSRRTAFHRDLHRASAAGLLEDAREVCEKGVTVQQNHVAPVLRFSSATSSATARQTGNICGMFQSYT